MIFTSDGVFVVDSDGHVQKKAFFDTYYSGK